MAIDGQGKFLFILNGKSNNISMFQIDQASGALSEVPASPFQVPPTINPNLAPSQPISIAAEKSGKFLFVGYFLGDIPGLSAVVSLAIDTSGLSPVLVTQHSIQTNTGGAPAQLLTDPKGLHLYVGLSQGQNKLQIGGAEVYSIDPASVRWATWAWPTARRQMKVAKNRSMFDRVLRARRLAYCSAFVGILLCSVFCASGCGSASLTVTPSPSPPQTVVTPSGTSTIMLTTSATSLSGTPLQLQPVQLTLTVK